MVQLTVNELAERFQQVDVSEYPDVHLLVDDLDVILWVLLVAGEKLEVEAMSATEIASVATLGLRRALTRQQIVHLLRVQRGLVARHGRGSPARFVLMRPGAERIRGKLSAVVIVDPAGAFTALERLDQILGTIGPEVLLCDPYVDDKTLTALTGVPKSTQIKLLTLNISDPAQFRRKLQAYDNEYGNLELRVSSTRDLHDRYMIDATRMFILGQSLNGIGKKQTFIVATGEDVRSVMETTFRQRWLKASAWR